jgi:uncharacterized membrane-anchored protein YhcB (DUF1043 family)
VISDGVLTTIITVVGSVIVAYITYRIKNAKPRKEERIDTAFDMYEAILKRQDQEITELRTENARLIAENRELRTGGS